MCDGQAQSAFCQVTSDLQCFCLLGLHFLEKKQLSKSFSSIPAAIFGHGASGGFVQQVIMAVNVVKTPPLAAVCVCAIDRR